MNSDTEKALKMKERAQLDRYTQIVKKTFKRHIPLLVHWELTYRCNLNCVHCYCFGDDKRAELSLSEIRTVLDKLARSHCLFITFTGGEILTRKDFFDIAAYARKAGFALRLLTNGTLITGKVADKIKELHPLSVEMTLYAANARIHESITRVPGSFERTSRAFRLLRERGVNTKVKSPLLKQNYDQLNALERLARQLGAGFAYDLVIVPGNDGSRRPLRYRLGDAEIRTVLKQRDKASVCKPTKSVNDDTFMCSAGLNSISISPYGDAHPCVGIKKVAGNLKSATVKEIMESKVMERVRNTHFSDLWACRNCEAAPYCYRCPGLAEAEDHDFFGASTAACRLAAACKDIAEKHAIGTEKPYGRNENDCS